jgi:hypothetical protein
MHFKEGGAVNDDDARDGDDHNNDHKGTNRAHGGEAGVWSGFIAPTKEA